MAILTVGATSSYPTIAAAMLAAAPGDVIQLESGYGDETATVTHEGITIFGDATSTGVVIRIGAGVATFSLTGEAPIDVRDAIDGEGIVGNAGANVITVTGGADAVDGGGGVDRLVVDYRQAVGAVTGDSTSNFTEAGGGGRMVTITDGTIEHFTVLTGAGADTITTGAGDDFINTGEGAGTVTAGQGANVIIGGAGADTFTALDGGNVIHGGDGTNVLTSGGGDDIITSGTGADTIVAGGGADRITIRGGADTVAGGAGSDTLVIDYSALDTNVTGGVTGGGLGAGYTGAIADLEGSRVDFDTTENFIITTGGGDDSVTTGDGVDRLTGGAGDDVLDAGGGRDVLTGGAGADQLDGGAGSDTAVYAGSDGGVTVRLWNGTGLGGDAQGDSLDRIENVVGSGYADTLIGSSGGNRLQGGGGGDFLGGLEGDDVLVGGWGADRMDGGAGIDTADYSGSFAGVTVRLNTGLGEGGEAQGDTLTGIENLVGSDFADLLIGEAGANVLSGGIGDDRLYGLDGDDLVEGGSGADRMDGGAGIDTLSYASADKRVEARLDGGSMDRGDATGDVALNFENLIGGSANDRLTGSAAANVIQGGDGADVLEGLGGDDQLLGGAGDDIVTGGDGADRMTGGAGADTLSYADSAGGVAVRLGLGTAAGGDAEGDVIGGFENLTGSGQRDTLVGSDRANRIDGGRGADFLGGLGGDDTLEGGGGDDRLNGGDGADRFVFAGSSGQDEIYDFSGAEGDHIQLDAALYADFDAVMAHAADSAGGVVIARGGVSLTLSGVTRAELQAGWFEFAAAGATGQSPGGLPALPGKADDGWSGAWSDARLAEDAALVALPGPTLDARDLAWTARTAPADWDWIA